MNIVEQFPIKQNYLYFNFSSDGPMPRAGRDAVAEAVEERMRHGSVAVENQVNLWNDIRAELAKLFVSQPDHFAFTKNTSEGVLLALLALDIKAGENYIVAGDAFPTTIKIMENHCKGTMRKININDAVSICDQLRAVIDSKTRVIVLDWVHYFSGKIIDWQTVVQLAKERNIFTIIDGIQGAGALSIELDSSGIDFFVGGGHKWLLSPQGTGYIYVSDKVWERIGRKSFGWLGYDWLDFSDFTIEPELRPGAQVLEYGTRSYTAGVGFRAALEIINEVGIKKIERHNAELKDYFMGNLESKEYHVFSIYGARRASIVPFRHKKRDIRELKNGLDKKNVKLALRNGYIRAAFHFINDKAEIDRFLELL